MTILRAVIELLRRYNAGKITAKECNKELSQLMDSANKEL